MMARRIAAIAATIGALIVHPSGAHAAPRVCRSRHGESYIRCAETGGQRRYAHDGAAHPGPSSASGAYGLLSSTRRAYGPGTDREIATRYMRARYHSWAAAERAHRAKAWW